MSDGDWWVADLLLVVLLSGLAGAGIFLDLGGPVRVLLALALVLVLPGYALVAAFFPASNREADSLGRFDDDPSGLTNPLPRDYEIEGVERAVLSVAFSIAIVPAVAAVASFTRWGVTVPPILVGVTILTVLFAVVAAIRRLRLPAAKRYSLPIPDLLAVPTPFETGSPLGRASRRRHTANLASVAALVLVLCSVGYAVAYPPDEARFTEFYVAGERGEAGSLGDYPSSFTEGQPQTVTVAVENHEGTQVSYTVVVLLGESGSDGELSSADVLSTGRITVDDGNASRVPIEVTPTRSGDDMRLQFLLFTGDPPTAPTADSAYRVLDLHVTVEASGSTGEGSVDFGSALDSTDPERSAG